MIPLKRRSWRHGGLALALASALALALAGCGGSTSTGSVATATPTVSPSPTATATIPLTPTPKPTFFDALTSNTKGWPTAQGRCEFANGGFQLTSAVCALPFFVAADGALAVDAKATAGDVDNGFGLVWRASSANRYQFGVTADGTWGFVKVVGGATSVVDSGSSSAIHQGLTAVNTLVVSFRGSHFEFFVNGEKVGAADDTSIASGVIGMFAQNGGTTVFNNFAYFA